MTCKGVCYRYKGTARFKNKNNKRCKTCGIFIKWEGRYCPCCNVKLSNIPKNSKYRQRLRNELGVKEIE